MPPVRPINIEIYTKDYSESASVSAKEAKEIFFLSTDDLRYESFERPSGWGAYALKQGGCKLYNLQNVKRIAIRKHGSLQTLIDKAEALNQRRRNKAIRDEEKRIDEARRRREAAEAAKRARLAEIERKKQIRLEKKRAAERQADAAHSWWSLVASMQEIGVDLNEVSLPGILKDVQEWKRRKTEIDVTSTHTSPPKKMKTGVVVSPVNADVCSADGGESDSDGTINLTS